MGTDTKPVIQVKNLYKVYRVGDSHVRALDGVNLEIYKGMRRYGAYKKVIVAGHGMMIQATTGKPHPQCGEIVEFDL